MAHECYLLGELQEKPQGAVPEAWLSALLGSGLATTDMATGLAALLSPKDDEEQKNVRKAAYLASNALQKFTVPQLEGEGLPATLTTSADFVCMRLPLWYTAPVV